MKFFSRFFATKPDFSKPDSVFEHEPVLGTEEFNELMCMEPEKRMALLDLTRLVCSHLQEHEVQAICINIEKTMTEGGDVEEVLSSCLSEEHFGGLRSRFLFTAEPRRLREASEQYSVIIAALGIRESLPSAVTNPPHSDVALSIAAFGDYLIENGIVPLHLKINSDTYYMLFLKAKYLQPALALAERAGLGIISNDLFRSREVDA